MKPAILKSSTQMRYREYFWTEEIQNKGTDVSCSAKFLLRNEAHIKTKIHKWSFDRGSCVGIREEKQTVRHIELHELIYQSSYHLVNSTLYLWNIVSSKVLHIKILQSSLALYGTNISMSHRIHNLTQSTVSNLNI